MHGLGSVRSILLAAGACGLTAALWTIATATPSAPQRSATRAAETNDAQRAADAAGRGDFARAITLQSRWLEDSPRDSIGWYALGNYQATANDLDAARRAWLRAVELQSRMAERTQRPGDWYRLARFHAALGDAESTLDALSRAATAGWSRAEQVMNDPAFATIRDDPRFGPIIEVMRTNRSDGRVGA